MNILSLLGLNYIIDSVKRMDKRDQCQQILNILLLIATALMLWKAFMIHSGCAAPIVVVLTGSMEPAFFRGDLLFLTNRTDEPVRAGDITVFELEGRDIPIVHRCVNVHEQANGTMKFLTKGDNNNYDDRGLYNEGQYWLTNSDMFGKVKGLLPQVGMITIYMKEYPVLKYGIIVFMALLIYLCPEEL